MTAGTASAARADGNASWRASAIAVVVLCLLLTARLAGAAGTGETDQIAFVAALFALPLLYAIPGARRLLARHRWPVLAIQAVLTVVPFFVFGGRWQVGVSGLLASLVLLTLPGRVSWPLAGLLLAAEVALRASHPRLPVDAGLVGSPLGGHRLRGRLRDILRPGPVG